MIADPHSAEDGNIVDLIAQSLAPGRLDILRQLFANHGAAEPVVLWSPDRSELKSPLLRRFHDLCSAAAGPDGRLREADFPEADLGNLADWSMRLVPEHGDFRYTAYGAGIQRHYGRDMTGHAVSEFGGHIAEFFAGAYRACLSRNAWLMTEHEPPRGVFVRVWRRLIVPLTDAEGTTVSSIAVLNVPENELRAGLELVPDPVFVANSDQSVVYANRAAERMFGLDPSTAAGKRLEALTGFAIEETPPPEELLATDRVVDSLQLAVRGGIADRHVMTVSAAEHRGAAFYVVVLRLIAA